MQLAAKLEMLLSGEDAAWLHLETEDNLMVVCGLLELGTPLEQARLEALLRERLLSHERFTQRVDEAGRSPRWETARDFELSEHLVRIDPGPRDDGELQALLSTLVSEPLDRRRPLWRIHFVPHFHSGSLLIVRVHHALADGFALLFVLLSLCDGPAGEIPHATRGGREMWRLGAHYPRSLARLVASPRDPLTPLKGPLGVAKRLAWSQPFPLERVTRAAHQRGATINDVLVSCVAGALRRYLQAQRFDPDVELHAMVPVNLRTQAAALSALGNHFGLAILPLPVSVADPVERLRAVHRHMLGVKRSAEAVVAMGLLWVMGRLPRSLERLVMAFFGPKASLVLTNVPGPRERLHLAGCEVSRLIFWVPQSARLAVGISLLSYAGEVVLGVMTDAGRVPNPRALVEGFEEELAALG